MPTRRRLLAALTLIAALAVTPVTAQGPADTLARAVQAHYQQVKDFTASFEQSYVGGALKRRTVETGTVAIRKPGRMRWDYERPEKKLFVADGTRMYFYVPADRQVRVSPMPEAGRVPTPILFLAGRGDLLRDFTVEEAPAPAPGTRALRLRPVRKEPEYETLTLVVDAGTYAMRQLVVVDGQGGTSTFSFTNLRENVGVPESRFSFSMPKGVDVITQD